MLTAELLAAFSLLCGLVAALIVLGVTIVEIARRRESVAAWDEDSYCRGCGAFGHSLPFCPEAPADGDASLDAQIAEAERRERASEGYDEALDSVPAWSFGPTLRECLHGLAPEVLADVMADPARYLTRRPEGFYPLTDAEHVSPMQWADDTVLGDDDAADIFAGVATGYDLAARERREYWEPFASACLGRLDGEDCSAMRVLLAQREPEDYGVVERMLDLALDDRLDRAQRLDPWASLSAQGPWRPLDSDDIPF